MIAYVTPANPSLWSLFLEHPEYFTPVTPVPVADSPPFIPENFEDTLSAATTLSNEPPVFPFNPMLMTPIEEEPLELPPLQRFNQAFFPHEDDQEDREAIAAATLQFERMRCTLVRTCIISVCFI